MRRHIKALTWIIVALLCAALAATAPGLLGKTRIGLEFRGGAESLFVATALQGSAPPSRADLLATATELGRRANATGVAEPEIRVESPAQIRVMLAGTQAKDEAQRLLQGPPLPVHLALKWTNTVGGVLGAADFAATMKAGIVALAFIFVLLGVVYRGPALFAVVGLLTWFWAMLAIFNLMHATLSLAAIVAFVLGVGIAADANILIFERMREERRKAGSERDIVWRSLRSAGRTILDASLANLIVAAVLFAAGIGPIRGFALTTGIGVLLSLACSLGLVGGLLLLRARSDQGPAAEIAPASKRLPFLQVTPVVLALLILMGVGGIVSMSAKPFNFDIDFKAGTALDISLAGQSITQDQAVDTIAGSGIGAATVAIGGAQHDQIAARFDNALPPDKINRIVDQFRPVYGDKIAFQENTADPVVAQDLARQALFAIALALAALAVLVTLRFGWRYAAGAMASVLLAAFLVVATFSLFSLEIDVTFIAALLTVMGYAVNDSVVVFDRIRENLSAGQSGSASHPGAVAEISLTEVLRRSILTVVTVVAGALSLYFLGAEPLQMFSLAIFCGLLFAFFATMFVGAPVWFWLARKPLPVLADASAPAE
jgi:SecD/SecF fusion protein